MDHFGLFNIKRTISNGIKLQLTVAHGNCGVCVPSNLPCTTLS